MLDDIKPVSGRKGGKGGGSSRTPYEAPDNLLTDSTAYLIDVVSEGEIEGWADADNPGTCIYFDDTPLQNADGSFNFEGVEYWLRTGTPDQEPVPGFSAVENEVGVSVVVEQQQPVARSITAADVDAVRVKVGVASLSNLNTENGDLTEATVDFVIEMQAGSGGWELVGEQHTITGKTTSGYQRAYRVELPEIRPVSIRVRRLTADAEGSNVQDDLYFVSYTEVIDAKLRYPDTAYVALAVPASAFGGRVPRRSYRLRGVKCWVPSNYDPVARTYDESTIWDGTFTRAYTSNPAFLTYTVLIEDRWGLGERIAPDLVDKWRIYQIGKYCDELVPDGLGGMEPRFTMNGVMNTREAAYQVVTQLSAAFRGVTYWGAGAVVPVQDAPADPVKIVTNANVVDGAFNYAGTGLSARKTAVVASFRHPDDHFKVKAGLVFEDHDAIQRYGRRQMDATLPFTSSAGEALRAAKWIVDTNLTSQETVSYQAGFDHAAIRPGDKLLISDKHRIGFRVGGRIVGIAANRFSVTLDAPVSIAEGESYQLLIATDVGEYVTAEVDSPVGDDQLDIQLAGVLPDNINAGAVFALSATDMEPRLFRVVSNTPEKHLFNIVALEDDAEKYNRVELGINVADDAPYVLPTSDQPSAPTGLTVQAYVHPDPGSKSKLRLLASWSPSDNPLVTRYLVRVKEPNSAWRDYDQTNEASLEIAPRRDDTGTYLVRVHAITVLGEVSPFAAASVQSTDVFPRPSTPTGWQAEPGHDSVTLWGSAHPAPDFKAFVIYGATADDPALIRLDEITTTRYVRRVQSDAVITRYAVTALNYNGDESSPTAFMVVSPEPPGFDDLADEVGAAIDDVQENLTAAVAALTVDYNAAEQAAQDANTAADAAALARDNAATEALNAALSASTAQTSAADAGDSATASAASASSSAASATDAAEDASVAQAQRLAAETASSQAQTYADQSAASATDAEGSASAAASSAGVSAQIQTAVENTAAAAGPSILELPAANWTAVSQSKSATLLKRSVDAADIVADTTFGTAYEFPSGTNLTLGQAYPFVWSATIVYEVEVTLRVVDDGTLPPDAGGSPGIQYRIGATLAEGAKNVVSNVQTEGNVARVSDGVVTKRMWVTCRDSANMPAIPKDSEYNHIGSAGLTADKFYPHIRQNYNATGTTNGVMRVASIVVRDITAQIDGMLADEAAGVSAAAAAVSEASAAASETAAGQSASAAQTAQTGAQTARAGAEAAETAAATSSTSAASSAASASSSANLAADAETRSIDADGPVSNSGFEFGKGGTNGVPAGWLFESASAAASDVLGLLSNVDAASVFGSQKSFGCASPTVLPGPWWRIGKRFATVPGQIWDVAYKIWAASNGGTPVADGRKFVGEDDCFIHYIWFDDEGQIIADADTTNTAAYAYAAATGGNLDHVWWRHRVTARTAPANAAYLEIWFVAVDGNNSIQGARTDYRSWSTGNAAVLIDDVEITSPNGSIQEVGPAAAQAVAAANAAVISARAASASADDANQSAVSAITSASTAQTAASGAQASQTSAAQSASDAAGSAASAASSATVVAQAVQNLNLTQTDFQRILGSVDALDGSGSMETPATGPGVLGQGGSVITETNAGTVETSGVTSGARIEVPQEQALQFSGNRVRVDILAKPADGGAAASFIAAYSTADTGNSGARIFALQAGWNWYSFHYNVPAANDGGSDWIGLWGDSAKAGGRTQFARVVVRMAPLAADIPELGLVQAQADITSVAVADLEGNAASSITMRAQAGSGGARLELVAADNAAGPTSGARISADNILLDGSVLASHIASDQINANHIEAGEVDASHINVQSLSAAGVAIFNNKLRSSNYVSGENGSGWEIRNGGFAEFSNIKIRRQLEIASGTLSIPRFSPSPTGAGVVTSQSWAREGYWRFVDTTPVNITAWAGAKKTYIAIVEHLNGGVQANSGVAASGDVYWGWTAEVLPLTKWSNPQTLRLKIAYWSRNVQVQFACNIRWKIYEVS